MDVELVPIDVIAPIGCLRPKKKLKRPRAMPCDPVTGPFTNYKWLKIDGPY